MVVKNEADDRLAFPVCEQVTLVAPGWYLRGN